MIACRLGDACGALETPGTVKVDGSEKAARIPFFRGPNPETWHEVYEFPDREQVDQDVGIIFVKIIQPTGKDYQQYGLLGICIDREAARLNQQTP